MSVHRCDTLTFSASSPVQYYEPVETPSVVGGHSSLILVLPFSFLTGQVYVAGLAALHQLPPPKKISHQSYTFTLKYTRSHTHNVWGSTESL